MPAPPRSKLASRQLRAAPFSRCAKCSCDHLLRHELSEQCRERQLLLLWRRCRASSALRPCGHERGPKSDLKTTCAQKMESDVARHLAPRPLPAECRFLQAAWRQALFVPHAFPFRAAQHPSRSLLRAKPLRGRPCLRRPKGRARSCPRATDEFLPQQPALRPKSPNPPQSIAS